jgi:prepilin-type N-terminal cleavage/methylation domain-containing protein
MAIRRARPPLRQCGMSLLEVLVAMAVAALFLSWLLPGAVQAMQRQRQAGDLAHAVQLARFHAEALSVWPAALPMPAQGRQGALAWRIDQVSSERPARPQPSGLNLPALHC